MKIAKQILMTLLCALAILAVGYAGIILCGGMVLESSGEPEEVTMDANISNLFYSRLEDDIQLYPWNYYPQGLEESESVLFMEYTPYVEHDVFYNLIALAADVEIQEVSSWYAGQEKTIMTSMKQGKMQDGSSLDIFFYDEVIRLCGRDYQVKLSCSLDRIISFSCIQRRETDVRETEEWDVCKEKLMSWLEKNPLLPLLAWENMYGLNYAIAESGEWYEYVSLYQIYLEVPSSMEKTKIYVEVDEEIPIQMIELKDCVLVMLQADTTLGLYYDVLEQRVVGFHYFDE